MASMPRRGSAALSVSWLICASLAAQHTPAPGEDPRGVVLDEQLRPIAGAAVSLQWEHGSVPFARAIAARLQRSPLPATRSGRDGTWVLPLTNEQRQMGAPGVRPSGCWLIVEKDGYLPWREPIPAGLPSYLGSRVLLRQVRADDVFADLPWPPAIVTLKTWSGAAPWLAPGQWDAERSRRGGPGAGDGLVPVDAADLGQLEVLVTAAGEPLAGAQLWFDDGAFARPAAAAPLPFETAEDGSATANVPVGTRVLRVTAPGFLPAEVSVEVARGERALGRLELVPAKAVDVLAVTPDGVAVPFGNLFVCPLPQGDRKRETFRLLTDATGRARVFVDDPSAWYAYDETTDVGAAQVPLDAGDAPAIVRVPKYQPVTIRLRGNGWPTSGSVRWDVPGRPPRNLAFGGFDAKDAEWVVFRLCHRAARSTVVDGGNGAPFRIDGTDLPPTPVEPLLDLVALDRTTRTR